MVSRKKLVLHIGTHKTATTFLQSSFACNAETLQSVSVRYPQAGQIYNAHFKLCWTLRDAAAKGTTLEDIPEWADLIHEINVCPEEIAVISAEEFGLSINPVWLEPLKQHFDVTVLIYVRSPDAMMQSFYNQFIKDFVTRETRTISTYLMEEKLAFLNNRSIIEPWMAVFGRPAIELRLFDLASKRPGGILRDFFDAIGINTPPDMAPPDISILQKVSLPPDVLEYLRFANGHLENEEGHYQFVIRLVEMCQNNAAAFQQTRSGMLSLKARQSIRYRFSGPNTWLAQTFFDSATSPFPANEAVPPPSDFDTRLEEADANVLGKVTALIHNHNPGGVVQ